MRKLAFFSFIAILFCCLQPAFAAETSAPEAAVDKDSLSHITVAELSDEQVRQLLIAELQKKSGAETDGQQAVAGPGRFLEQLLSTFETISEDSEDQAASLFKNLPDVLPDLKRVFLSLCPYGTHVGAFLNLFWVVLFILCGYLIELLIRKFFLVKLVRPEAVEDYINPSQGLERLTTSLIAELPAIIGLFIFFGGAYLMHRAFFLVDSSFVDLVFFAALISITLFRLVTIASRLIFAPQNKELRVLPIECSIASAIHYLVTGAGGYAIFVLMFIILIHKLGALPETILFLKLTAATILLSLTAFMVITYRKQVANQILTPGPGSDGEISWAKKQFAAIWHIPALIYLGGLWLLTFNDVVSVNIEAPAQQHARGAFLLSFFIVPIWIIADIAIQWIVKYSMATLKIHDERFDDVENITDEDIEEREKGKAAYRRVMLIARACLVAGLTVWVASLWNITIPLISRLSSVMFDALIIVTLSMLVWKVVSDWLERKILESAGDEEQDEEEGDEWGSAAARGRSYTLLPMIRKFIATVLMTMVTLTLLSALGVDIGPLLAGAGVIGLAVGFGAQKLVADMFSGFFYLLDDAFRVGEYIESASGVKGVVENISLRNIMLRHHRGMLQIVPHSELGSITNFMRGGIIVKFNLDFPYDADIDQIRKVIKKVGIAMLADPELGDDFIKPVKSQGVREITNSVMTIRVKFTAKPGTHFVIRREAFKRITEALRAKGIEYAHKKVIVDMPVQNGDEAPSQEQATRAATAAAEQALAEEQAAKPAGA